MTDALDAQVRRMFLNRLRSLHNIDHHYLPELTDGEWISFRHNPTEFLIRADDTQAAAIWREVERRQRRPIRTEPAQQAAE